MDRQALRVWLDQRLTGPSGLADYKRLLDAGWDELRQRKLVEVVPRASVDRWIEAHLVPDRVAELVHPWVTVALRDVVEDARKDTQPVGRWIPDAAKTRIERLVMRPGAVDPGLIRAMFKDKANEAMLADTLTATIKDFSTMIPKLILSLVPKGPFGVLGGASNIVTKLVEEVERRLEPEIHRFVAGGTKRALERAADFAVAHADDATSVEQRRNLLRFLWAQSGQMHVKPIDEIAFHEIELIGRDIARHIAERPETKVMVKTAVDRFYTRYDAGTVGQVLDAHHLTIRPPIEAIAESTWPALQTLHVLPIVQAWREALIDEILALMNAPVDSHNAGRS